MNKLLFVIFSVLCLALLYLKLVKTVEVDPTSVLLLTLAGLPWIFPYLKGMKLPGGIELEFKEVKRLVEEVQQVNKDLKEQAERVEDLVSEPERPALDAMAANARQRIAVTQEQPLEPKTLTVLKALLDSRFVMRTFSGIAMDTHLSTAEVDTVLRELERRGLAQVVERPRGLRAIITAQGRQALMRASPNERELTAPG